MSLGEDTQSRIRNRVTRVVREHTGFSEQIAVQIAAEVLERIVDDFRGERVYVSPSRDDRRAAVRRDFNGRNHEEVCKAHGISERTLYRYLGGSG